MTEKLSKKTPKMPKMPKSLGACVDKYHEARQKRLDMQKEVDALKEVENFIYNHIIDNIPKGDGGAVGKQYKAIRVDEDVYSIDDDDAFYGFIKKTGSFDLLNRAINQKAVRERLEDEKFAKKFPKGVPGTKAFNRIKLSVTKV